MIGTVKMQCGIEISQQSRLNSVVYELRKIVMDLKTMGYFYEILMSQSIPTGYIPPGNPQGLAQKTCPGGRDLTFENCPAGNSTRTGILRKIKVKLQKNSVDQIFTAEFFKV